MNRLARWQVSWLESAVRGLTRLGRGRGAAQAPHLETGLRGEEAAYFYLRRKGYVVVARRWASRRLRGDLDLIAWDGTVLCMVEVKSRTAHDGIEAQFAVDAHKREVLRRLARQYVRQLRQPAAPPVRFDVISVYMLPGKEKEILHFEGCFGWREWDEDDRGR